MNSEPRMARATRAVLQVLLDPESQHFGLQIARETGLPISSVYPILVHLQQADWLESDWEDIDPVIEQRPPRRFYRLTAKGFQRARAASDAQGAIPPVWNVQPGRATP